MNNVVAKADTLIEALPYLRQYRDSLFVFKYGGHAMRDPELRRSFLMNIVLLKHVGIVPVIVHGGGPQIEEALQKLGIAPRYHNGVRITDPETMKVVEMVLVGQVGSELVRELNNLGGNAVGLSGPDAGMIAARRIPTRKGKNQSYVDLGEVGEITRIDPGVILRLCRDNGFLPVISPVAVDDNGKPLNVNADTAAAEIAASLKARKLVFLTDVEGVLDFTGKLIPTMRVTDVPELIRKKIITGGMVPKMHGAAKAVKNGVGSVAVIDGRSRHAVLLEIFTDRGLGTLITA